MNRNLLTISLAITTLILGILYGSAFLRMHRDMLIEQKVCKKYEPQDDNNGAGTIKKLHTELAHKQREIIMLRAKLAEATNDKIDSQIATIGAVEVEAEKEQTEAPTNINDIINKLKESGFLQNQNGRMPLTVREKYSSLIAQLGLAQNSSDRFIALLERKGMFMSDQENKSIDKDIQALIGEEAFEEFEEYERTMPTRLFVDDIATYFVESGYPLTDEQAEAMLEMDPAQFNDIPLSYSPASITLDTKSGGSLNDMVDGGIENTILDMDNLVEASGKILNESQMEVFDEYLGDRFQQREAAAETASQILPHIISREFLESVSGNPNTSIIMMSGQDTQTQHIE